MTKLAMQARAPVLPCTDPAVMNHRPPLQHPTGPPTTLAGDEAQALLAEAMAMKRAKGGVSAILRGRHVALLCEPSAPADAQAGADAFTAAATALGAVVVRLQPSKLQLGGRRLRRDVARTLGGLYSAIACEGMDEQLVAQLLRWTGVLVLHGVAAPTHPTWLLAGEMTAGEQAGAAQRQENHRFVLQALLARSLR